MFLTTLSSKGQIILPSEFRKKINIEKGTKLIVEIENNKIILTPVKREFFENIAGSLSSSKSRLLSSLISEKEKEKYL
ncbi:MAG: AbrB/MazE/SpoVT family DNA-binding domain-containing protein [Actinomycetota bacterium]